AVGDVVCCYARCLKTGNSSITVNIEVWVKKVATEPVGQRYRATEAVFTYVAVDENNSARRLPEGKTNFTLASTME
ncbi:acyl-CoA esterase, partial [Proteus mirabilis]